VKHAYREQPSRFRHGGTFRVVEVAPTRMGDLIVVDGADPYSGEAQALVPRWLG